MKRKTSSLKTRLLIKAIYWKGKLTIKTGFKCRRINELPQRYGFKTAMFILFYHVCIAVVQNENAPAFTGGAISIP